MRALRMSGLSLAALLMLSVPLLSMGACRRSAPDARESRHEYFCVMHPQIVQDHPGQCPICQMKLERRERGGAPASASPVAPAVEGRTAVVLSPEKRQLLGVRSEAVRRSEVSGTFRIAGRVSVDERRVHHVHSKFDGYVERLFVDFTGRLVRKGEPLLGLYSPELVATQQEYLVALRAGDAGRELKEAARRRLALWDVSEADVRRLEQAKAPLRTLDLYAPMDGYVLQKGAVHGMRVTPVDTLFEIANLQTVWIVADVYEQDLPRVEVGATAQVRASHIPDRTWTGRVTFIAPTLDPATRTIKVRVEVPNADSALKPDMFADVMLEYERGSQLVIPVTAALDTGRRQIVFVDRPDGALTPREVSLGPRVGELWPVLSGLAEGERVVVSANFLVDSESSLRAAIQASDAPPGPADPHAGHGGR
jgi:membrane fusion protein, copper/silver efflux system